MSGFSKGPKCLLKSNFETAAINKMLFMLIVMSLLNEKLTCAVVPKRVFTIVETVFGFIIFPICGNSTLSPKINPGYKILYIHKRCK